MNTLGIKIIVTLLISLGLISIPLYYRHKYLEVQVQLKDKENEYIKLQNNYNDVLKSVDKQNKAVKNLANNQKNAEKLSAKQIEQAKKDAVDARKKANEIKNLSLGNKDSCVAASDLFNEVLNVK